ncbi:MAG: PhoP family transcriptional regulator, partial [Parcubacteria group bacterium GW2011_GWB1_40_14]
MEPQKPILIVEDEKSLMEAVRIKLTHDGFTTSCAGSAEEAEEIMKTTQPSLIWLDLMLPGMQGLDFLRKVRTTEEGAKIPVVVVSNSGSPDKIR